MPDWKAVLQKLVRVGDRLPEELRQSFRAGPPARRRWPKGLPTCPALREFYSLCDGGRIGFFAIRRQDELGDLREWSGDDAYEPGRYLIFGDIEFGHPLVWDGVEDRVGYHDQDGADGLVMSDETGLEMMGLKLSAFLENLFARPVATRDEMLRLWAETLDKLDQFD